MSAPGIFRPPAAVNEPVRDYLAGSPERERLRARLERMRGERLEIPLVIGGEDVRTGTTREAVMPHDKEHVLADVHQGGAAEVQRAIDAAAAAWEDWSRWPWEERAAVFLRAAELLAGPWRDTLNAATMLGQSKTAHQAEIDAACELIDFLRFNVQFMTRIYEEQPISSQGVWNRLEYRPLEGFVFAVTPFNFTAIGGNLPSSVALMGNTVVWKPASTAMLSAYYVMRLFQAAGLPDGVINLVYGSGAQVGDPVLASPHLAGIHFTGSTPVFHDMWKTVGGNIDRYRNYPRIVGETGGKDFIVAHPSADVEALAAAIVRGSFEYQGQKCSAASRVYAPSNLWPELRERLQREVATIRMGDPADFSNFMGAVIDQGSFETQREAIEEARASADSEVVVGGGTDSSRGYFVEPTVIETRDPAFRLLRDELFGPVVTTYVYDEKRWDDTLGLVDETAPYGLTGAIFSEDRGAVKEAQERLRYAAGNFYVNDKPTGAVVGQQPFGGARASGTNDKAGSMWNLIRWVSPRSIKETFVPARDYRYPFLGTDDGGSSSPPAGGF
ncbi:MAG TPA: L-glutamate gamma-semialdehyde dehydrogenase [Gaiellaceae bacterium]|nr:L-glutamate gamma-semialdehyde dehydrogenase [Gaiellaceae bacterium]